MCAFSLAAELFQVVCFHCLHSLSQPPHAGPSTPSPALRPCVGSASSLAGGANASCAPRPADPQLWTPDARVQRLPVSVRQVQLRRVLPRPCLPLSLGGSSIVPASAWGGSRTARPVQHEVLRAPPSEYSQSLSALPTPTLLS